MPAPAAVAAQLPGLPARLGARSLLDAPGGDLRWLADLPGVAVLGVDVAPAVVGRARATGGDFRLGDLTCDPRPRAEIILCRDCFVHLSFAKLARAIANFRASGATWPLTTTSTGWRDDTDCTDDDWRALDLTRAPFNWPASLVVLDQAYIEGDGSWADKALGLWRLGDLS